MSRPPCGRRPPCPPAPRAWRRRSARPPRGAGRCRARPCGTACGPGRRRDRCGRASRTPCSSPEGAVVEDALPPLDDLVEDQPGARTGWERGGKVLVPVDRPDVLVAHDALPDDGVVREVVEYLAEHGLERHPRQVGADALVDAEPEGRMLVGEAVQDDLVRL